MLKTSNLFSIFILLWSLGSPAQALYNPLDKLSPPPFGEFSAVGQVYSSQMPLGNPPCSGVLVAPKLVLTAFHCIASRGIQAKDIKFITDKDEVSLVQSVVYSVQGSPRAMKPHISEEEMLSIQQEDLILLRLKSPIISARPAVLANLQDRVFEKQPMWNWVS